MFTESSTLGFNQMYEGGKTDSGKGMNPRAAGGTGLGNLIEQSGGNVTRALGLDFPVLIGFIVLAFILVKIY